MRSSKPTACSLLLFLLVVSGAEAAAVEVAPRISDREIIEALAELKAGQQTNQQQIADLKQSTQQQIADLKQSTQQQIADLRQDMNQRFNDLRQDMNQRFDALITLLQILIGTLVVVLGAMLAWLMAIWRRLVRVEERQTAFETQDDEIKFLKDNYGHLHELFVEVVKRAPQQGRKISARWAQAAQRILAHAAVGTVAQCEEGFWKPPPLALKHQAWSVESEALASGGRGEKTFCNRIVHDTVAKLVALPPEACFAW